MRTTTFLAGAASCLALLVGGAVSQEAPVTVSLRGSNITSQDVVVEASKDGGGMTLTVGPGYENSRVAMGGPYRNGRLEVAVKSASVAPGIITSVYVTSGGGRSGGGAGSQDEIDFEWKGNDPYTVQTNVFLSGQENLQVIGVGGDSSQGERTYAFEWNDREVNFYINGALVRSVWLYRPLEPMMAYFSVWTTSGGWPGLIRWAGDMNWNARGGRPASANFRVISMP